MFICYLNFYELLTDFFGQLFLLEIQFFLLVSSFYSNDF